MEALKQVRPSEREQPFDVPPELGRIFRAIVFDWDGTAVPDRRSDARALVRAMERSLLDHVLLVIITGTSFEHLNGQALRFLSPAAKRFLYVCTNRGSEVYGFKRNGEPTSKFKREATAEENRLLDQAARGFGDYLTSQYGIESEIISNRLNRRKIDLIPLPEWADPKKSDFPLLLRAVEERLHQAHVFGGLKTLVANAVDLAKKSGLRDPKVTSDIKHIELGLTDKSDSVSWITANLLAPYRISLSDVVFAGDEFGKVGGLAGSDALMRGPSTLDANFFSVGAEPKGPGQGIHDLKGGPRRFIDFLNLQHRLRRSQNVSLPLLWKYHSPTPDEVWCVEQEGLDPSREREMETIFTIGNGYLGVRGALDTPIPSSQPDLYIAGIYDRKVPDLPYSELEFLTRGRESYPYSELVSLPSPFHYRLSLDKQPLNLVESTWLEHTRILDLKKGLFFEHHLFQIPSGRRLSVDSMRCTSTIDKHLLLQEVTIRSEDALEHIELDLSLLDPKLALKHPHLRQKRHEVTESGMEAIRYKTHVSGFSVGVASRVVRADGQALRPGDRFRLEPGGELRIRRYLCVYTSRDTHKAYARAKQKLEKLDLNSFDAIISKHEATWSSKWAQADIEFSADVAATETKRFNSYHLMIAAPSDSQISIGARTLSGRGYEGHIFWDAEIFILPFFLHTFPAEARKLLLYRYHTLEGARRRARAMGHPGACFAWESTVTGDDTTPDHILLKTSRKTIPIFTGEQQLHVTADVAYAIDRYWKSTQDHEFLREHGVEILVETARFWTSRCKQQGDLFHVLNVVGPDEYHHGVNDNAFTNWMVKHNLARALFFLDWLKSADKAKFSELESKLGLGGTEPRDWRNVHDRLYVPMPNERGIIEQFEGFFDLEDHPLRQDERLKAPIDRLFDWKETNRLKLLKQADVLMLPFLFRNRFSKRELAANFRYYEPLTDHGSSLSPSVHATIAAWIGDLKAAHRYFNQSLELDLFNVMKNTALGIHAACMGGTWQALVFGLLGVQIEDEKTEVDAEAGSRIPDGWGTVSLKLKHRRQNAHIAVGKKGGIR